MSSRSIIRGIVPTVYKLSAISSRVLQLHRGARNTSTNLIVVSSNRYYATNLQVKMPEVELPVVDFDYVKKAATQGILIIDVREPFEVKEMGKIPNSINIPIGFVESNMGMSDKEFQETYNVPKPKEDTEVIFYCKLGRRSGIAQRLAINMGFKNVKNYLGSWTEWAVKIQ